MAARHLRVAVIAEEAAGVQVLHGLMRLAQPPEIVAVLTRPAAETPSRPVVAQAAEQLGLDVWPSDSVKTPALAQRLQDANVDLLLNVHSLFVIHPDVLAAPTIGGFNLHPGPLPEYAGLNVPSWAIYEGESSHGVTVHWIDERIDAGAIVWQERFPIAGDDTGLSLSARCIRLGVPLILRLVEFASRAPEELPRVPQDLDRRRYFAAGPPREGRLDWSDASDAILRFVRAADYAPFRSPWGHPTAELAGHTVGIAKATATETAADADPGSVVEVNESGALVATGDDVIVVERLWVDGRYLKPEQLLRQ